jgi:NAD+ kinase
MKTIGILARPHLVEAGSTIRELVAWLRARGLTPCLDDATAVLGGEDARRGCRVNTGREVAAGADALVVMGGDGTLLAASRLLDRAVPVLGVNFGSLGFLTEITPPELLQTLEGVLAGRFEQEERRLLHAVARRRGHPDASGEVLNDVVLTKAGPSRIIELEVTVDGLFVSEFRADGLIVSSPTGSTAYNLAAGGPILHPTLPAIVLTPICPHMLSNRPLVVGDGATIEVRLKAARDVEVYAAFDGQQSYALADGDSVTVTASAYRLHLVKAPGRDYYEVLRTKLKWGEKTATRRDEKADRGRDLE